MIFKRLSPPLRQATSDESSTKKLLLRGYLHVAPEQLDG